MTETPLSDVERDDLEAAFERWFTNAKVEIPFDDHIGAAYRNGYLLAAVFLLMGATDTPELDAAFRRHRISLDPQWWLDGADGWKAFHDQYKVECTSCGTFSYGRPDEWNGTTWPDVCRNCAVPFPEHRTWLYGDEEITRTTWFAECACGWVTERGMVAERYAKGAATKHVKAEGR